MKLSHQKNRSRVVAQKRFIRWMKHNEPFLYRVGLRRMQLQKHNSLSATEPEKSGFSWSGLFTNLVDTVKSVAPTYLQAKQQKRIIDMQMKRAEQGLPPADVQAYTPAIRIAPEITPDTQRVITQVAKDSISSGTRNMLLLGGLGLGALVLLKRKR
jgi:hypothetical protein